MKRFVIDRIETEKVILQDEDGTDHEITASLLPRECRSEGAVLSVPTNAKGALDWSRAERDRVAEKQMLADGKETLDRLRRQDPGGDVKL